MIVIYFIFNSKEFKGCSKGGGNDWKKSGLLLLFTTWSLPRIYE